MAEVRLEVDVAHPPERVWWALTDAGLLREWFMTTDLEPHEGGTFTLDSGELPGFLGPISGEVSELEPPWRIVMLWQGEKLHTRVVWEVVETADGCQVRVVQSGFIGAPASVRRRVLRATYLTLFADRLPAVLDRLVADEAAAGAQVPRQWRATAAAPVGGESGIRPAAAADPARAPATLIATTGSLAAAEVEAAAAARIPAQRVGSGPDRSPEPDAAAGREDPQWRRRAVAALAGWSRRLAVVPAWGRALAVGAAAAVVAIAVLATVVQPAPRQLGDDTIAAGEGEGRGGPGTGVQPGAATTQPGVGSPENPASAPAVPEDPGVGGSGDLPASPPASPGATATSGYGEPTPGRTGTSGPAESGSVLAAEVTVSGGMLGLGGSTVSATVSNPGPVDVDTWEVTMDVGDQDVTNVSGAEHVRDGSRVTFTPSSGLAAGESTTFSFHIPGGLLGLGGADDPTDCTIDGLPC